MKTKVAQQRENRLVANAYRAAVVSLANAGIDIDDAEDIVDMNAIKKAVRRTNRRVVKTTRQNVIEAKAVHYQIIAWKGKRYSSRHWNR